MEGRISALHGLRCSVQSSFRSTSTVRISGSWTGSCPWLAGCGEHTVTQGVEDQGRVPRSKMPRSRLRRGRGHPRSSSNGLRRHGPQHGHGHRTERAVARRVPLGRLFPGGGAGHRTWPGSPRTALLLGARWAGFGLPLARDPGSRSPLVSMGAGGAGPGPGLSNEGLARSRQAGHGHHLPLIPRAHRQEVQREPAAKARATTNTR